MIDVADVRDAIMEAEALVTSVIDETIQEFNRPDQLTELAMMVEMMPDDAWDLVDDETKDKVMEVL